MSIPAESIEVGKCYLVSTRRPDQPKGVRRIVRILPDGRIQFEHRIGPAGAFGWKVGIQDARSFAFLVEREVPCEWTPEQEE